MRNTVYRIPIKEKVFFMIEKVLDLCLWIPPLQRYVNRKANNKYGINFLTHKSNSEIDDVFTDYRFNDIQKDDVVLDIGANVGAFSIFVSRMVKHVYAVEPILNNILIENIRKNNRENITVIPKPLGDGLVIIKWSGCNSRQMFGKSLASLIRMSGGHVDFLKMDCEGAEWCINSDDLKGIRRIEAEIHNFDGFHDLNDFLNILDDANFVYDYETLRKGIMLVHAWRLDETI